MWDTVLDRLLNRLVREGHLLVTYPDGSVRAYGTRSTPPIAVQLRNPALPAGSCVPRHGPGRAYMDGTLTVTDDDLPGLLALLCRMPAPGGPTGGAIP